MDVYGAGDALIHCNADELPPTGEDSHRMGMQTDWSSSVEYLSGKLKWQVNVESFCTHNCLGLGLGLICVTC